MGPVALLVALAAFAPAAYAHAPGVPAAADAAPWQWSAEPWLASALGLSLLLYAIGVAHLWRSAGVARGISTRQVAAFGAGWVALATALISPLDAIAARLFSAHMLQHELLMLVAAPLLVLGRPLAAWAWAFNPRWRKRIAGVTHRPGVRWSWDALTQPVSAWALHAIALWLWHVPSLFEAALHSEAIHALQHASFFATALLFWWAVLGADPRSSQRGFALAYLFTTMLHTSALGALLTLAPTPWYPEYAATSAAFGLDPVQDQQLGGLVMWVPGGFAYIAAALVLLARLLAARRVSPAIARRPALPR